MIFSGFLIQGKCKHLSQVYSSPRQPTVQEVLHSCVCWAGFPAKGQENIFSHCLCLNCRKLLCPTGDPVSLPWQLRTMGRSLFGPDGHLHNKSKWEDKVFLNLSLGSPCSTPFHSAGWWNGKAAAATNCKLTKYEPAHWRSSLVYGHSCLIVLFMIHLLMNNRKECRLMCRNRGREGQK